MKPGFWSRARNRNAGAISPLLRATSAVVLPEIQRVFVASDRFMPDGQPALLKSTWALRYEHVVAV